MNLLFEKSKYFIILLLFIIMMHVTNSDSWTYKSASIRSLVYDTTVSMYDILYYPCSYIKKSYYNAIDSFFEKHYGYQAFNYRKKLLHSNTEDEISILLLKNENENLKKITNYIDNSARQYHYISGRVASLSSATFRRNFMLNIGLENNIKNGDMIINNDGIVGRIIESNNTSARVIPITEIGFKTPALVARANKQFIVFGIGNLHVLALEYLDNTKDLIDGDLVVTSGEGGVVPYGIVIGYIVKKNAELYVTPSVDINNISLITVITMKS